MAYVQKHLLQIKKDLIVSFYKKKKMFIQFYHLLHL